MSASSLRVAHVSAETGFSGGEVQVFLLMEGLRERGHENLLLCPPGSRAEARARERGIAVRCMAMGSELSPGAVRRIAAALREQRSDLVHCHTGRANWLGGLAARRVGVAALSTRRMDRRVKRGLRTRFLYGSLMRRVAAISPAVEARLRAAGVPGDRIRLVWSAVDAEALAPSASREAVRQRLGEPVDARVVLVAANLVHRKGIDVLLEAFARLSTDARLWVAGEGPERAALEAASERHGLGGRVRFLGRREDVPDLLEACDLFALPSRQEGLGVAALEAMARARPVVATAVGGLAEAVTAECGRLVPPEDAGALADALDALLGDPELAARLGAAGARRIASQFAAERMVASYEALYREVLAEVRARRSPGGSEGR